MSRIQGIRTLRGCLTHPIVVTSTITTGLLMIGHYTGVLQFPELTLYDQLVRWQPDRSKDPRMLIIEVTEADLARYSFPIADRILAQAIQNLQRHQPRVIGLDMFRNFPRGEGHADLLTQLRQPNIIAIHKLGSPENPEGISRPASVPAERAGFNDVVTDPDGVLRRNLLFAFSGEETFNSFAVQVALAYFTKEKIMPRENSSPDSSEVHWGKAVFKPLETHSGGYHNIDAAGYQILLNYRSARNVADRVTLTQVVEGRFAERMVRNKIVLIGTTAPSVRDVFFTPYSPAELEMPKVPGVYIHAQMVSQLLDAVLGIRPPIGFWPEWVEGIWLWSWALLGGMLAWRVHHPVRLGIALVGSQVALIGLGFGLLSGVAIWVPLAAPGLNLVLAMVGTLAYRTYQMQQERRSIVVRAQTQEKTIALLQTLLTEKTHPITEITRPNELTALPADYHQAAAMTADGGSVSSAVTDRASPPFLLAQRYKLLQILGAGGFGLTYLAEDTQRPGNPTCVVKYLLPARSDIRFLHTARRLFKTEAEILEKLGRHDRIPQLLAAFEEDQRFYLVQEFIEGVSLSDELTEGHCWSESQVVAVLKDVLEVLVFIHSYHVIHRDLKPSNLIRRKRDGHIVVIDFGAVKQMQPQTAEDPGYTVAIGTRGYAPPEQLAGHPGLNSDLFALGMIAIQALTGISPQQFQQHSETGTVIWRPFAAVDPNLADILDRMVHYYFNERYASAAVVLQDLKPLIDRISGVPGPKL